MVFNKTDLLGGLQSGETPGFPTEEFIFFSYSLGAFLPTSSCHFCKEEVL